MAHDEYSVLESAIHITKERDKKSLENSLVDTLSSFIDFEFIILLRLSNNADDGNLEIAASLPRNVIQDKLTLIPDDFGGQRVQQDDCIALCIDQGEPVSDEHSTVARKLFPIIVDNAVLGVLDIYGYHNSRNTDKLVNGFISLYSNFLTIINDSERDALTGLLNRRTFDIQLSELILASTTDVDNSPGSETERRSVSAGTHHWVGILDIDHFKSINDNFGHVYGDEVLLLFANLMKETFRGRDLLFRYGGEEFVVVLTAANDLEAHMAFERFRKKLELYDFPQVGRVTVSAGIVSIDTVEHQATLLEHADKALYYAKEHGRNQIRSYNELISDGKLQEHTIESDVELF